MSKEKDLKEQENKNIVATKGSKVAKSKTNAKKEQKKFPTKELPRLFKKKYTEKKLNKKIYSKIYVPEDKKYIQSLFVECGTKGKKNIQLFAISKDFNNISLHLLER